MCSYETSSPVLTEMRHTTIDQPSLWHCVTAGFEKINLKYLYHLYCRNSFISHLICFLLLAWLFQFHQQQNLNYELSYILIKSVLSTIIRRFEKLKLGHTQIGHHLSSFHTYLGHKNMKLSFTRVL